MLKGKLKKSKANHKSTGVKTENCYFLYSCHWYNNKCAEPGNKWRLFQVEERTYAKGGRKISRASQELPPGLYSEAGRSRRNMVGLEVRQVENRGDHRSHTTLSGTRRTVAITVREESSQWTVLHGAVTGSNFLNDHACFLYCEETIEGPRRRLLQSWDKLRENGGLHEFLSVDVTQRLNHWTYWKGSADRICLQFGCEMWRKVEPRATRLVLAWAARRLELPRRWGRWWKARYVGWKAK